MTSFLRFLFALSGLLASSILSVGSPEDDALAKLPAGQSILSADGLKAGGLSSSGSGSGKFEFFEPAQKTIQMGTRLHTLARPKEVWQVQFVLHNKTPVNEGDVLLAMFWAQNPNESAGRAVGELTILSGQPPHPKLGAVKFSAAGTWRKYYLPFQANANFAVDGINIAFRMGYDPQVLEIGDLQIVNYGKSVQLKDLPKSEASTPDPTVAAEPRPSTPAAPPATGDWKTVATNRVNQIRRTEVNIKVTTANGQPARDARLELRLLRPTYGMGTTIDGSLLLSQGGDQDRYRQVLVRYFTQAAVENELKWEAWDKDPEKAKRTFQWLHKVGIAARGHALVAVNKNQLPPAIAALFGQPDELRKAILEHIKKMVGALNGLCPEWDVTRDSYAESDLQKVLGDDFLAEMFETAHEVDPAAKLFLSESEIFEDDDKTRARRNTLEKMLRQLLEKKVPIGGLAMQATFTEAPTPPARVVEILERYDKLGLPIQITNFGVDIKDERKQGDYARDFMYAACSIPSTRGITVWGHWQKQSPMPSSALYKQDWSRRHIGNVWHSLREGEWSTARENSVDGNGIFKTQAFLGEYLIIAKQRDKIQTVQATLGEATKTLEIVLN